MNYKEQLQNLSKKYTQNFAPGGVVGNPGFGTKIIKQYKDENNREIVEFSDGKRMYTDSPEYKQLYSEGLLYGESPDKITYPQENANPEMQRYKRIESENPFSEFVQPYFEGQSGAIARATGQSQDSLENMPEDYKKRYDESINKKWAEDVFNSNPQNEGETRGEYLNRVTQGMNPQIVKSLYDNLPSSQQTTLWQDGDRGLRFAVEGLPGAGTAEEIISRDSSLSDYEKQLKLQNLRENPMMGRIEGNAELFAPVSIAPKLVQSTYRPNYSPIDALMGRKNDAGILEDIATDPLNLIGTPVGLKGLDKSVQFLKDAKKIASHPTKIGRELLKIENEGLKLGLSEFEIASRQMDNVGITSRQRKAYMPVISDLLEKYVTPQGYEASLTLSSNSRGTTKFHQILENIKNNGYNKDLLSPARIDSWKLYLGKPQVNDTFKMSDTYPINHPAYNKERLQEMDIYNIKNEEVKESLIDDAVANTYSPMNILDKPITYGRDPHIMGGYNRLLSRDGLQYNDVWDLEPTIPAKYFAPKSIHENPRFENIFYPKDSKGIQTPLRIKIPIDKIVGKPFMSHGNLPYTSTEHVKVLRDDSVNKINSLKNRFTEDELLQHPLYLRSTKMIEDLKNYPKFQQGGEVKNELQETKDWWNRYINSPKYLERLQKEFPDSSPEQVQRELEARKLNLSKTYPIVGEGHFKGQEMKNVLGYITSPELDEKQYSSFTGKIKNFIEDHVAPSSRPVYIRNWADSATYNHETSHSVDESGRRIPLKTVANLVNKVRGVEPVEIVGENENSRYLQKPIDENTVKSLGNIDNYYPIDNDFDRNNGSLYPDIKWKIGNDPVEYAPRFGYRGSPTEVIARLQPLREELYRKGIHDSATEDISKETLMNYIDQTFQNENEPVSGHLKDLWNEVKGNREQGVENLQWMLNNIAQRDEKNKKPVVAQKGGRLTANEFLKDYIDSPMYLKRLQKMGYSTPEITQMSRLYDLKTVKFTNRNDEATKYNLDKHVININDEESKKFKQNPESTKVHELSHAIGSMGGEGIVFPGALNQEEINSLKWNMKPLKDMYADRQGEYKADMDAFRFMLKRDGIYDTGKTEFTQKELDIAKQKYKNSTEIGKRFLDRSREDRKIIWLMNNIASNNNQNSLNIAQKGGSIGNSLKDQLNALAQKFQK